MVDEERRSQCAPCVGDVAMDISEVRYPDEALTTTTTPSDHDRYASVLQEGGGSSGRSSSLALGSGTKSPDQVDGVGIVRIGKAPAVPLKKTTARPGKKDNRDGWARLPMELIHRIMDHVERDIEVPSVIRDMWGRKKSKAISFSLIALILARCALCTLRAVCREWAVQVDKHPFWMKLVVCLDTTRRAQWVVDDMRDRAVVPRKPPFVSHFERALCMTRRLCLVCRINRPDQDIHAMDPDCATLTTFLQNLPTCGERLETYCAHCLVDDVTLHHNVQGEVERRTPRGSPDYGSWMHHGVSWVSDLDIDETGQRRRTNICCTTCRFHAVYNEMRRIIQGPCRRNGPLRGLEELDSVHNTTMSAKAYIDRAVGTAQDAAILALDEFILSRHAKWLILEDPALSLQDSDIRLRDKYFESRAMLTDQERRERWGLLATMYGEETVSPTLQLSDQIEVRKLYAKWGQEALNGESVVLDSDDEDDVEDGLQLNRRWTRKLREGVINDYINDRVRLGFWVSPEDEIAQLASSANPPIHAPIPFIAISTKHPFDSAPRDGNGRSLSPVAAAKRETATGWIDLVDSGSTQANCFLPTPSLAQAMEVRFAETLGLMLWRPFRSIARTIQALSPSRDMAAATCEQMSLDALLRCLARKESWTAPAADLLWYQGGTEAPIAIDRKVKRRDLLMEVDEDEEPEPVHIARQAGIEEDFVNVSVQGKNDPPIELVVDDLPPGDYDIRESWTSPPCGSAETPLRRDRSEAEEDGTRSSTLLLSDTEDDNAESVEAGHDYTMLEALRSFVERKPENEIHEVHGISLGGAVTQTLGKRKQAPGESGNERGKRHSPKVDDHRRCVQLDEDRSANMQVRDASARTDDPSGGSAKSEDAEWMYIGPPTSSSVEEDERSKGTSETSSGPNILTPEDEPSEVMPNPPKLPATESKAARMEVDRMSPLTESLPPSSPSLPLVDSSSDGDTEPEGGNAVVNETPAEGSNEPSLAGSKVPWIPTVKGEMLGPRAGRIIMDCWFDAWAPLRRCDCTVCERRRTWDSWTERA